MHYQPTILGADVAGSCGLSLVNRSRPAKTWRTLAIEAEGKGPEESAGDFAVAFDFFLKQQTRPDFCAIEMPERQIRRFPKKGKADLGGQAAKVVTINPMTVFKLNQLMGSLVAVLELHNVPWGLLAVSTWRTKYYGSGYRPPDDDWKAAAVNMARQMGVVLPGLKVNDRDAAEAVGIAFAWQDCNYIPPRHHAAFMRLRSGNPVEIERAAS